MASNEDKIPEGLDDLLGEIRSEGKGGALVAVNLKKFLGEDKYDKYYNELLTEGRIDGDNVSPSERKEGVKTYKKDKISFKSFVDKVLAQKKAVEESSGGNGPNQLGPGGALVVRKSSAITSSNIIPNEKTQEREKNLDEILSGIDDIIDALKKEEEGKKKERSDAKRKSERSRRKAGEDKLESGVFKGLAKQTKKILAPVQSILDKILGFLMNVLIGRVLVKVIDWMDDPKNKEKLEAIGDFLKKRWPILLAAYLLFGNSLGRFIVKLGVNIVKWSTKILKFIIPKLFGMAKKLGWKKGLVLGSALLGTGMLAARVFGGDDSKNPAGPAEKEGPSYLSLVSKGATFNDLGTNEEGMRSVEINLPEGGKETLTGSGMDLDIADFVDQNLPNIQMDSPVLQLNSGGMVPGIGNKDTVPAMLTPGEFVVSKGAVNKFGPGTFAAMNAAGGGTNRPTVGKYSGGGLVSRFVSGGKSVRNNFVQPRVSYYSAGGLVKGATQPRSYKDKKESKEMIKISKSSGASNVTPSKSMSGSRNIMNITNQNTFKSSDKMTATIGSSGKSLSIPGAPVRPSPKVTNINMGETESQSADTSAGQAGSYIPSIPSAPRSSVKVAVMGITA